MTEKDKKFVLAQKQMILTSQQRVEHPFMRQNTQQYLLVFAFDKVLNKIKQKRAKITLGVHFTTRQTFSHNLRPLLGLF